MTSYVFAATTLADTISKISQPVTVLQAPKDFNWAIPKTSSSTSKPVTNLSYTKAKTPVKTSIKIPTKNTAPSKPVVTVVNNPLPINFDANGVLRIRTVGKTEVVEMLVKDKNGGYIGVPYYGLGNFVTFNAAPSTPKNTNTTSSGAKAETKDQATSSSASNATSVPTSSLSTFYPMSPGSAPVYIPIPTGSSGPTSTSALPEGLNLYFTQSRSRESLSGIGPINYNSTSGII